MINGGRIGKVRAWFTEDPSTPQFRLVVEGGRVTLGCWRSLGREPMEDDPGAPWMNPRTIFERIS